MGGEEEGSDEGHEGDEEEGSHEGHEGYEEEGSHEDHEGDEEEGSHEGHEGDEEEGGHEGHEGDEEEGSHEGHEGDGEESSHEGHEGDEEEVCEQDCEGPVCQSDGASWEQGEDRWGHDIQGSLQEQARQGCEQEGHTSVCKGKGYLQPVSAALLHVRIGMGKWRDQLQVWGFPQLWSAASIGFCQLQ